MQINSPNMGKTHAFIRAQNARMDCSGLVRVNTRFYRPFMINANIEDMKMQCLNVQINAIPENEISPEEMNNAQPIAIKGSIFLYDPISKYFVFGEPAMAHCQLGYGVNKLLYSGLIETLPYHLIGGVVKFSNFYIHTVMASIYVNDVPREVDQIVSPLEEEKRIALRKELLKGLLDLECSDDVTLLKYRQGYLGFSLNRAAGTLWSLGDIKKELS